jgi:hypothetical protein
VLINTNSVDSTAPQSLRTVVSNSQMFSLDPSVQREGGVRSILIFDITGVSFRDARMVADYVKVGKSMGECQVNTGVSSTSCYTQDVVDSLAHFINLLEVNFSLRLT